MKVHDPTMHAGFVQESTRPGGHGASWFGPLNAPIANWTGRRVWLVGASSGIGADLARELGRRGAKLVLTARRPEMLASLAAEIGPTASVLALDVTDAGAVARQTQAAAAKLGGGIDLVVWLAGNYVPMRAFDFDLATAKSLLDVNYQGTLNGLASIIPMMLAQGSGGIALVASVAGYRGLPKSLGYGPTKAAMINLAESLYVDLAPRGLSVYIVNPGFVRTPLTAGNDFEMPALISAHDAALAMLRGLERGAFEIDFPRRFTVAMKLLRMLPNRAFLAIARRMVR